jgi:uncharacterized protein DUF4388
MNRSTDSPQIAANSESASARSAADARDASFAGRLKALSVSDVLEFLRVLNRRGVLVLRDGAREVRLQVRDAHIQAAASSAEAGMLAGFLFKAGQLTREQLESVLERERNGERVGRILIEAGLLTPKDLWEALRRQARSVAAELFEWQQGEFRFRDGEEIAGSGLELGLPILDVIAEGIRSVRNTGLFQERMPSDQSVFETIPATERKSTPALEPHESYVLSLVDGQLSLSEVVGISELGRAETLRVVFLLFSLGYLKMKALQALPEEFRDEEALSLVRRYNEMFAFLYRYLLREVGPIGDAVLGRYFEEQQRSQRALLAEQRLGRDGTLDERLLQKSLRSLGNGARIEKLIDGLNELLYAELLAVRRTLGSQHEGRAVQGLRELGLQPVTQVGPETGALRKE